MAWVRRRASETRARLVGEPATPGLLPPGGVAYVEPVLHSGPVRMFNRLFGRKAPLPTEPGVAVVRNVTIGRTVMLDELAWRRFGADTRFPVNRDTLQIVAQGLVALDAGGFVHRFYTEDHIMFQLVTDDREGAEVNDISLFAPWDSAYPSSRAEREAWKRRMSAATFQAPGLPPFRRFWFGEEEGEQPPVTFWEDVHDDRDGVVDRRIFQSCMLYHREIGAPGMGEGRELLLAIEQEAEGEPVSHELMLGVPLEMGEFRV
jgi:hypothetical protein